MTTKNDLKNRPHVKKNNINALLQVYFNLNNYTENYIKHQLLKKINTKIHPNATVL
jgi:hypothetical protein